MVLIIINMLVEEQLDIANEGSVALIFVFFQCFQLVVQKIILFQCKLLIKHNLKSLLYYHDIIEIEQKNYSGK